MNKRKQNRIRLQVIVLVSLIASSCVVVSLGAEGWVVHRVTTFLTLIGIAKIIRNEWKQF
jgi:hypothetical protein